MPAGVRSPVLVSLVLAGAALAFAAFPESASAAPGEGYGTGTGGRSGDVIVATVSYDVPGGSVSSGCSWVLVDGEFGALTGATLVTYPFTRDGVVFHAWRRDCPDGSSVFEVPERTPEEILPELLNRFREDVLPKPTPVFEMLDRDFGWAYVRTPLDFRAGPAWRPVSVSASLGPVWATVTATPVRLTFDPGDPAGAGPVSCGGTDPVAGYVPARPGACSYTYVNASSTSPFDGYHFATRLTIDWSIAWTSSSGVGGALAPFATSTDVLLAVAEVKGLVTCTGPRPGQGGCS